jgi:hypothetical protein
MFFVRSQPPWTNQPDTIGQARSTRHDQPDDDGTVMMARIRKEDHAGILRMVDVEHRKVTDIAVDYGCTPATIYALLARLRRTEAPPTDKPVQPPLALDEGQPVDADGPAASPRDDMPRMQMRQTETDLTDMPRMQMRQTETGLTDMPRMQMPQTETGLTDMPRMQMRQTETDLTDMPRMQIPQTETDLTDMPRMQMPQTETGLTDMPRMQMRQTETGLTDMPRMQMPQTETGLTDTPDRPAPAVEGTVQNLESRAEAPVAAPASDPNVLAFDRLGTSAAAETERRPARGEARTAASPAAARAAPAGSSSRRSGGGTAPVGARLAKPGFGLMMRTADGEENLIPFRSLDDLLSAIKPILRASAGNPDPVWFSLQPVDLATIDMDAA